MGRDVYKGETIMPKAPIVEVKGLCGEIVETKTWKQGHSIKCKIRGGSSIRYWQPDKKRYWWGNIPGITDIQTEVRDFCRTCKYAEK